MILDIYEMTILYGGPLGISFDDSSILLPGGHLSGKQNHSIREYASITPPRPNHQSLLAQHGPQA